MEPICTTVPMAWLACFSSRGRNSSIRGTIQPFNRPHPDTSNRVARSKSPKTQRTMVAENLSSHEGFWWGSFISDSDVARIMTRTAPGGSSPNSERLLFRQEALQWNPH